MLTLLAESKTMSAAQEPIDPQVFNDNRAVFEDIADAIMSKMAQMNPTEIAEILGVSQKLAIKAHELAYDFPYKTTGYKSIYGFTGEAFKGFDVATIPTDLLDKSNDSLRIVSSVYGLLKPYDIIKPYRCEFNKPTCPDSKTSIQTFRQKATVEIVNYIKNYKAADIIDLLPGDADKCLDWKIIRAFTSVHKVCFQIVGENGKLKTPLAKRLKELRGIMGREIILQGITSFKELCMMESPHFIYSPLDSKPGLPVFLAS